MNRREFVQFLALITAGAAARPEQIEAFMHYYQVNTPEGQDELVAVDDIMVCGLATESMPVSFNIYRQDKLYMALAINLFGGVIRWVAAPDQKIIIAACDFYWLLTSPRLNHHAQLEDDLGSILNGHISYIDMTGKRHIRLLTENRGSLI